MKKFLLTLAIVSAVLLCSCSSDEVSGSGFRKSRFKIIRDDYFVVVVDKETKVMYVRSQSGGALTVLVNAEGKPLLFEGE